MKLAVVLAAVIAMGIALLCLAPVVAPVKQGGSRSFWWAACRVDLGSRATTSVRELPPHTLPEFAKDSLCGDRVYRPTDGTFVYAIGHLHGEWLYRVEASAVTADLPKVAAVLDAGPPEGVPPFVERGFDAWKKRDAARLDARALLNEIHEAEMDSRREKDPDLYQYALDCETVFAERWRRADRYWLTLLFEFVYLATLIVFAALPWLRNGGRLQWSIHLGLLLPLLLLPHYLGYAPLAFTSAWPGGGVLYSSIVIHFRGMPWTALDTALLEHAPRILEPLSQPTGPAMVLSGLGGAGPVATSVIGIAVGALTFAVGTAVRYTRGTLTSPP